MDFALQIATGCTLNFYIYNKMVEKHQTIIIVNKPIWQHSYEWENIGEKTNNEDPYHIAHSSDLYLGFSVWILRVVRVYTLERI